MAKPTDIRIQSVSSDRQKFAYRTPMKFGGRVVEDVVVQRVIVVVESADQRTSTGVGEMTMGTAWAWPSRKLSPEQVSRIVIALADRVAAKAQEIDLTSNPIELGLRLIVEGRQVAEELATQMKLPEPIPELAIQLACSPVDAAIHDAFGRLHRQNSFRCLSPEFIDGDLSQWLGPDLLGKTFDDYVLPNPKPTLALYHLVGALDPLSKGELSRPVNDGLPETLEEWITTEGLSHLKVKLTGSDLDWDVGRVIEVDRIATIVGISKPWNFSLDFNECCPNEDYVLDFIERVDRLSRTVLERIQYIEQPTSRDLKARKDITMHRVARIKPVVIDESLTDIESLRLARQLGYSGIALKACKGQTESLLLGAAAQHYGMFVCVQDLTCTGASFLHSAALASHLPAVSCVEGNGRQYCPIANVEWEKIYRPMFRIRGGVVPTELLNGQGLGFRWPAGMLPKELAKLSKTGA
jgi:L-alanine-DL-glutamate epimerase-like enolase superfamily enzyme